MDILRGIKSGEWKQKIISLREMTPEDYKKEKRRLPGFTASGVFSYGSDSDLIEHSGLHQVDIDDKHNKGITIERMTAIARQCPHAFAVFRSPSGKGVKMLVRVVKEVRAHAGSHVAAVDWLDRHGVKADIPVSALSQLCFVSYDPECWINEKATEIKPVEVPETSFNLVELEELRDDDEILEECEATFPDFSDLWAGIFEDGGDHSFYDHRLICMLRDCCKSNERVAELFEKSGLYRPEKWNGRTRDYVFQTLRKSERVQMLAMLSPVEPEPGEEPPAKKKTEKKPDGWTWETSDDVPQWTPAEDNYIVKGMMYARSLSCIYGPSGSGKTFKVLDIASCIAMGRTWNGRKVRRHAVMYFGLEGKRGLKKRIQALKLDGRLGPGAPFSRVLCGSKELNLLDAEHVTRVVTICKAFEKECGLPVGAIFIDTLARSTPGGDENSSQDMGVALVHAERISTLTGANVCVVHHSGKDITKGMRGSTAIYAGLDEVFEVTRHEDDLSIRVWSSRKQRDEDDNQQVFAKLRVVQLGVDSDGEPVTSCVVDYIENPFPTDKKTPKNAHETDVLMNISEDGTTFEDLMDHCKLKKGPLFQRLKDLADGGYIVRSGDKYYPVTAEGGDDDFIL